METIADTNWLLTVLVFAPLVGALIMVLIPQEDEQSHKQVALFTSLVTLGLAAFLLIDFNYGKAGVLQYFVDTQWIEVIGAGYTIGVDGMSLPLIALTALIMPLVFVYSWNHIPEPGNAKAFLILSLILETGMIGTFVAQDLVLFFVFFEVVLLPMFFMIAVWGGENRRYASLKFFLFTLFGSALMLLSFLALFFLTDAGTFSMLVLTENAGEGITRGTQLLVFAGMFLGFGVKVPMFPFHTWLPDAHTEAPTQGSVILAAVLLKLGTYGFIRIAIPMLPEAAEAWAPWIGLLAVIGIIYGALGCLAQTDMKRLIAFSSVAHMGFVMLGIATLTDFGINAAIFGMVAHGLITGMLFFIAGSVKERYHTLEIKRLGGMLAQAPRLGWILGFVSMASLGLPGLAGFWGEFPAILAAYNPAAGVSEQTFRVYMVVAAVGTVLAAGYLLWLLQRTAMGEPSAEFADDPNITDVSTTEWIAWAPLLFGIVLFGVAPGLIFEVTDPAVTQSLDNCITTLTGCEVAEAAASSGSGGG
ncbi:MAG: NADH-quinone oxidoreductase subunit M [Acidimicrobiaceae bacterium]|nr:NADH-quinone oxidoreductase subunit M [Acidimicrobiaceae bacterium]MXW75284.1 NADH-quinone oxidoreductase subunit M [Acidimicrobiaceae bacterium]MYD07186.1 NADH-quinone oxidoreductase subunit M [Acidimicrobiaceae bacterium]MYI59458.1 NADH-quinone oxidoreductase subunit M [Acidimicrobiaceae bacterium]